MNRHYPTIKNTIRLLGSIALFQIILAVIICLIVMAAKGMESRQMRLFYDKYPALLSVVSLTTLGLGTWWGFKRTKTDWRLVFPFKPFSLILLIPITLLVIGLNILLSDFDNLLRMILHWPPNPNEFISNLIRNHHIWTAIFSLMIVAPLSEEFLFRGLIFTGYLNNYSFKKAIWVSAFWFALFHLNVLQFPVAFVGGFIFAWLVGKTNSLWPALFAHSLMNGMPILIIKIFKLQIVGYSWQGLAFQPLWLDLIGLLLILVSVGLFWLFKGNFQNQLQLRRSELVEEAGDGDGQIPKGSPRYSEYYGIMALTLGIIVFVFFFIIIGLALTIVHTGFNNQWTITLGLVFFLSLVGCLTGIGFGIAGVLKKQRQIASWIGLVLNGLYLVLIVFAFIMGRIVG
jgi:membrane protease YdiL (CAAX protease family)